jgi:hypothetical protein
MSSTQTATTKDQKATTGFTNNAVTGTQNQTQNQNGSSGPEAWMRSEGQRLYETAGTPQPYQSYGGERVAELGPDSLAAIERIRAINPNSPDLGTARGVLDSIRTADANDPNKTIQDRMNPYIGSVLDATLRRMGEQYDKVKLGNEASATMSGAFGDARHGIVDSEANRNHERDAGDATNRAYSEGWDKAQNQENTVMSRLMAIPGLYQSLSAADLGQKTGLANILDQFGQREQTIQQAKDNVGYSDFNDARNWNTNQIANYLKLLGAVPHSTDTTSSGSSSGNTVGNTVGNTYGTSTGTTTKETPDNSGLQLLGKLGGTVLGGVMGGPIGASLGSGIGSWMTGGGTSNAGTTSASGDDVGDGYSSYTP